MIDRRLARRMALPGGILAGFAVLFAIVLFAVESRHETAAKAANAATAELSGRRAEIDRIEADHAFLIANRARFDSLVARGFVGDHDRLAAAETIKRLAARHRIGRADFEIKQAESVEGAINGATAHLQTAELAIQFDSPTDRAVFDFLADLAAEMKGKTVLRSLALSRVGAEAAEIARDARAGLRPSGVQGSAIIEWIVAPPAAKGT